MGVVYEAFDRVRNARVAIKTMQRLDAAALYRFKNEFRALADVAHPNLAALHELEAEGDQVFFTMEYVEGVDFLTWVGRDPAAAYVTAHTLTPEAAATRSGESGPHTASKVPSPSPSPSPSRSVRALDLGRLRDTLIQLVQGVVALHAAGKLHRDLKPPNVLVTKEGRVVLLDFGLVANLEQESNHSVEHSIVGTPEYMSPEQAALSELTEASDWYAIGVMLFQALTGELPFQGPPLKVLLDKQARAAPRARDRALGVPDELDELCAELLLRAPAERPLAEAILARLEADTRSVRPRAPRQIVPRTMPTLGTTFIGRAWHMAELAAAFESVRGGRPVVAYVHGSSGMGKSLLVRRWVDLLAARGEAVTLTGRCYEHESVPYKALDTIVDALSRHLLKLPRHEADAVLPSEVHALVRLFPVLNRVEAIHGAPRRAQEIVDPQELRRRAATALREFVTRITLRRPLVLWIDDLQWGDLDSAALIHELVRAPAPPPFLLIVSYRTEDADAPLVASLREAHARDDSVGVRQIEVGPLAHHDARKLALSLLNADEGDAAKLEKATIVADESRGSPLFVDELVRHVIGGETFAQSAVGTTLRLDDVVHARVLALPLDARRLLEAIAVAGKPIARTTVAAAARLMGEGETTALAVLRTGRLVRSLRTRDRYDVETYHDRIRETVVSRMDGEERKDLHHRLAVALVAGGAADTEALVVHFREAGDTREAAQFAVTAAQKAVEALAFERAAALWQMALELPGIAPVVARDLEKKRGDALANAGRGAEAAAAYSAAIAGGTAGDRLELSRLAAEQLLRSGRLDEGMRAIQDVLAAAGMKLPRPWLVVPLLIFHELVLRLRGFKFKRRDASELSATELTRIDVSWSVGATLGVVRPLEAKVFQKKHLMLALRAGEPTRIVRGLAIEAATCAMAGVPAQRRTKVFLDAAQSLAAELDDPYSSVWTVGADGISAYLEGRFRKALELCERAGEQFRSGKSGTNFEAATTTMFTGWALFHLGEMAELTRRMPLWMQDARVRGDLYLLTNVRIGLCNSVWLAADDVERARSELDEAMGQWGSREQQVQQYYELLARVHVDLYQGRGGSALELIGARWNGMARAHLFRIQAVRLEALHLRARAALATLDERPGDRTALERSVLQDARRIARERSPWSTAMARLLEGAIAMRRGDRDRALRLLAAAIDEAEANDMMLWAAAARYRRGEILRGDEGKRLLDDAVARLGAQQVKDPAAYCAMLAPGYPR